MMTGAFHRTGTLRALFGVMVALVLAARLLAPAGFMPVVTPQGVMVTLCTGQGAIKMMVERAHPPEGRLHISTGQQQDDGQQGQDHCPFAGAAAAQSLPQTEVAPTLSVWHLPTGPIAIAVKTGWIARIAAPPPPSSGPPSLLA